MEQVVPHGWAGVDVGKGHHWVCLIDEAGATLWSAKVVNDESAILEAIAAVLGRAEQVVWAGRYHRDCRWPAARALGRPRPAGSVRAWADRQPNVWRLPG